MMRYNPTNPKQKKINMTTLSTHVAPIHFEDMSGEQFERLVFAYFLRTEGWKITWNGQCGKDGGRDIIGIQKLDNGREQLICIFCANWQKPTLGKIKEDLAKVLKGNSGSLPDKYIAVFGGPVSSRLRASVKKHFEANNINDHILLSGVEFEEHLRKNGESLLKRFFDGEPFPEEPTALEKFVNATVAVSDDEILALMAGCFDRPAFTTPFLHESNLPAFKQALTDTISAINTGICHDREGNIIRRIPGKAAIKDDTIKDKLSKIVRNIEKLRATFDSAVKQGDILCCKCGEPDCPTVLIKASSVICKMDKLREQILKTFSSIHPKFHVHSWRGEY